MDKPAVTLQLINLKKKIGNKEIIKGLDFEIRSGEVFGFLGPNGAGKTTTIRMLVEWRTYDGRNELKLFRHHLVHIPGFVLNGFLGRFQ